MASKEYAIGIDVGATSIKVGLVTVNDWKIIAREVITLDRYDEPDKFFSTIPVCISSLLKKNNIEADRLHGIGIGMPGCVDSINGIVQDLVNLPKWHKEVHVKEQLEKRIHAPTFIDNDVNVMSIAELVIGAGKGCRNMVCATLGTGVGGGVILNGKLYRGSSLSAGEIGHIALFKDGIPCNCGNKGCLERYVGNGGIVKRTKDALSEDGGQKSAIIALAGGNLDNITPKLVYEAAQAGDQVALQIWQTTGEYIGVIFAGIVNMLNPDKIVIGGGVAQAGTLLFEPIIQTIRSRAMKVPGIHVQVVPAVLGKDAGIFGAAIYSIKPEFHEEPLA